MAIRYLRTGGSDSNNGSSVALAWATLGKALGTTGLSAGDTLYIAPGFYGNTNVTISMTTSTTQTLLIGDPTCTLVDWAGNATPGEVRFCRHATEDTNRDNNNLIDLNSKSYLTFRNIVFNSGGLCVYGGTTTSPSTNLKFEQCRFEGGQNSCLSLTGGNSTGYELTVDRCVFLTRVSGIFLNHGSQSTGANFAGNVKIQSCVFLCGTGIETNFSSNNQYRATTGFIAYNCLFHGSTGADIRMTPTGQTYVTDSAFKFRNCIFQYNSSGVIHRNNSSDIDEDYNRFVGVQTLRSAGVAVGANSKAGIDGTDFGEWFAFGGGQILPLSPFINSKLIGSGTTNSGAAPTTDLFGKAYAATPAIGPVEYGNYVTGSTGLANVLVPPLYGYQTGLSGANEETLSTTSIPNRLGYVFQAPEAFVCTQIGIRQGTLTGSPGTLRIGIKGITGTGTADSAYLATVNGGSGTAYVDYTGWSSNDNNKFIFVTLPTGGVSLTRGQYVYVEMVCQTGTWDANNKVTIARSWNSIDNGGRSWRYQLNANANPSLNAGPNLVCLRSSTKTYGFPIQSSVNQQALSDAGNPDEAGMKFKMPATAGSTYRVRGVRIVVDRSASLTSVISLYNNTTMLQQISVDTDYWSGDYGMVEVFFDEATLSTLNSGTEYILAMTNSALQYATVPSNADKSAFTDWTIEFVQRVDGGAWTETSGRIPGMQLILDETGGATASAGGLIVHPGMTGGIRG